MISPVKGRRSASKVAILYGAVAADAAPDEQDVLVEVETARAALAGLGFTPVVVPITLDLEAARQRLMHLRPALVFNLVESVEGQGRLIHLAPALLESLSLPFTGSGADAAYVTSNKPLAKRLMRAAGIATPDWVEPGEARAIRPAFSGPYIVKSVWEHASIGIDDSSIAADAGRLSALIRKRQRRHGGEWFVEAYVEGREFNLSLIADAGGVELLPPAEMCFVDYPPGKPRIVNYAAKWEEASFEYHATQRRFEFPATDGPLLAQLEARAKACWHLFGLRGYARVDCRVDSAGNVQVLEININPCLSPDAGFAAAAARAGLDPHAIMRRILGDLGVTAKPLPLEAAATLLR
ncbi:MAG TPA: D-alanine--D-alanine ligase [Candidatus Polarisedimenticolia bacterium]|nr:D-alanine--D-alanine ligase [Candidatus Polarisedimenticolia bacterium]